MRTRTRGLMRQIKRALKFSNPLLTTWRSQSLFPPVINWNTVIENAKNNWHYAECRSYILSGKDDRNRTMIQALNKIDCEMQLRVIKESDYVYVQLEITSRYHTDGRKSGRKIFSSFWNI